MKCSVLQSRVVQCGVVQRNIMQCSVVQSRVVHCSVVHRNIMQRSLGAVWSVDVEIQFPLKYKVITGNI